MQERFVVLYTGVRGDEGPQAQAIPGPQGPGFRAKGDWGSGNTYAPGDAVSAPGSAAAGIYSLFVQRENQPASASNTPPRDDPARWLEVGPRDLSNVTGTIWRVTQNAHGFTRTGTPIGYSVSSSRWVEASNKVDEEVAVGIVREVLSANEFIIQTTGEIAGLDPELIEPVAGAFTPGRFYFVSSLRGRLTLAPTTEAVNYGSNALLLATGPTAGVVLQWQQTPNVVGRRPAGFKVFSYTATAGQTVFSGPDLDAAPLVYEVSDQTRVFVNGVALSPRDGFTATTGTSVTLATGAAAGARVDIYALLEPLAALAPATALMLDSVSPQFDGVRVRFPLTVGGGNPVALPSTPNVQIWLDGNTQEPFADYQVVAGETTDSDIVFSTAPETGTRFWGLAGVAVTNLAFFQTSTLVVETATVENLNAANVTFTEITADLLTSTDVVAVNVDAGTLEAMIATLGAGSANVFTATTLTAGTFSATSGTVSGALVAHSMSVATSLAAATATIAGVLSADTINGSAVNAVTGDISGNLQAGSLTLLGLLSGLSAVFSGTVEADTCRAANLLGPTAGGTINAVDLVVDEGVF